MIERRSSSIGDLSEDSPWHEYRRLVLHELNRINASLDKISTELNRQQTEIALLQLKAGVWGVAAGAISGTMVTVGAVLLRGGGL